MESSPEPDTPPPASEEGNTSDVSMVDDGLTQHDSDVMVEEEREEDMETGAPASSTAPVPPKELLMQEGALRLGTLCGMTTSARHLKKVQTRTYPMTQILMRTSYWGWSLTSLFPGNIWMIPSPSSFPPGEDNL